MTVTEMREAISRVLALYTTGMPDGAKQMPTRFMAGLHDGMAESIGYVREFVNTNGHRADLPDVLRLELLDLMRRFDGQNDAYRLGMMDGYDMVCRSVARVLGIIL